MTTKALARTGPRFPSIFNEFLAPFNDWFDGGSLVSREMTLPPVNITEQNDDYQVSLAAPGLKKDDFNIDLDGNLLTTWPTMCCNYSAVVAEGDGGILVPGEIGRSEDAAG